MESVMLMCIDDNVFSYLSHNGAFENLCNFATILADIWSCYNIFGKIKL